jgi:hypothetical protein
MSNFFDPNDPNAPFQQKHEDDNPGLSFDALMTSSPFLDQELLNTFITGSLGPGEAGNQSPPRGHPPTSAASAASLPHSSFGLDTFSDVSSEMDTSDFDFFSSNAGTTFLRCVFASVVGSSPFFSAETAEPSFRPSLAPVPGGLRSVKSAPNLQTLLRQPSPGGHAQFQGHGPLAPRRGSPALRPAPLQPLPAVVPVTMPSSSSSVGARTPVGPHVAFFVCFVLRLEFCFLEMTKKRFAKF